MLEQTETSAFLQKVDTHLAMIRERGPVLLEDPRHGAVHGTSLETIRALRESGVIIGSTNNDCRSRNRLGDISVYPTVKLTDAIKGVGETLIENQLRDKPYKSRTDAVEYAKSIAQRHAFLATLKIPISDVQARNNARDILLYDKDKELWDYFRERGIHPDQITAAFQEVNQRRGFLLGISPMIANYEGFSLEEGDPGEADIRIVTDGKRLPYSLISGIEPLGPREEEFLKII